MPEGLEVETYRQQAEAVVGRRIVGVDAPDAWYVKKGAPEELAPALVGRVVTAARRIGKLLVLDLDDGTRLGLRFGMTGRLLVDGAAAIEKLEYSSARDEPAWTRFTLHFDRGGDLRIRDPRRLGGVELDPEESRLGPDAATITVEELRGALGRSTAPIKARLLDQSRIAGIGNLLADDILWRAGIDPLRPASKLSDDEVEALQDAVVTTFRELGERGGSHMGEMRAAASLDGLCPRDGTPLVRRQVGGRTTWSCPTHQV
ncbi:MAG TPA: DNA-formamidopyrimidine glycosylase family protein [Acidimicrobiales bacterium]